MTHVFISHATADGAAKARELADTLEATGQPCWYAPRDIIAGQTYPSQIMAALDACAGMVLLVTPSANASRDVAQEVQVAHARGKTIVPLIVDATPPSHDLAYFLAVRHHVPWTDATSAAEIVTRSLRPQPATTPGQTRAARPEKTHLTAADATAGAAAQENGVSGTFEFVVRSTGVDDGGRWLNSHTDYRDPSNLGVTVDELSLRSLLGNAGPGAQLTDLIGRTVRVTGTARKVKIAFFSNGRETGHYYFQTHLKVTHANQIELAI